MRAQFLPAIVPSTLRDRWGGRPMNWLAPETRGTLGHYPAALISAPSWMSREEVRLPESAFVFGDSGAFGVATNEAVELDPLDVLRWQLRSSDVGVILDRAPAVTVGRSPPPGGHAQDFRRSLARTVSHVKRGLPVYVRAREGGISFRWWGVIHGTSWEEMERWFEGLRRAYPFDAQGEGWCLKPYPERSIQGVARCLRFIREKGIRHAHFLGVGGVEAVTVLMALGPSAGLEALTFDATSPVTAGNYRTLFISDPDDLGWRTLSEKPRFTKGYDCRARSYMIEDCGCQSCAWLRRDLEEIPDALDSEYWKYRMAFHNTLTAVRVYRALHRATRMFPKAVLRRNLGRRMAEVMAGFGALTSKLLSV